MSYLDQLTPALLSLQLDSFIDMRWGHAGWVRPQAASHEGPARIGAPPSLLAGFVWTVFTDDESPRAIGIRLLVARCECLEDYLNPYYEIVEWDRDGQLHFSCWQCGPRVGWHRARAPDLRSKAAC